MQIASLRLDVLVFCDIGMDTFSSFLAHSRLAPVQLAFWGHPMTTGLASIDYFISSPLYENLYEMNGDLGPEARHAEQLVLLDGHDQRLKIQKPHMKAPRPLNLRAVCFRNSNAVGDRPTGVSHPIL